MLDLVAVETALRSHGADSRCGVCAGRSPSWDGHTYGCKGWAIDALLAEVRRLRSPIPTCARERMTAEAALDALRPLMQSLDAVNAATEGLHVAVGAALKTLTADAQAASNRED